MREIRTSGSRSGRWKRSMVELLRHRRTKGPATDRRHLNHRATSRLYPMRLHDLAWRCTQAHGFVFALPLGTVKRQSHTGPLSERMTGRRWFSQEAS